MTEVQSWVLIGAFATLMTGVLTMFSVSFTRVLRAELGRIDVKFEALETKFDAKFDALEAKFDALDRDVTALTKRIFGEG